MKSVNDGKGNFERRRMNSLKIVTNKLICSKMHNSFRVSIKGKNKCTLLVNKVIVKEGVCIVSITNVLLLALNSSGIGVLIISAVLTVEAIVCLNWPHNVKTSI